MELKHKTKFKQSELGTIPENWEIDKLENHLIIKGRIGWKGLQISEYIETGPFIVGGLQIKDNNVLWEECAHITESRYEESPEIMLREDDILMTKDGTIGKLAYIRNLPGKCTVASHIHVIRKKSDKVLPQFLFYFFKSAKFQNLIENKISGSVVPALTQKDINNTVFPIPPIQEQQSIAKILSDLDSKIELNHEINKTLKAINQAIFRHWFIDFEFPDNKGKAYKSSGGRMINSEEFGKEIPKEWEVKPIDEIADFINGLALQNFPAKNENEFLPVIKIRELRLGITESSDKASLNIPSEYIVNDGDVIFSWSGSLEVVIWGYGRGALNQHLFKVTSRHSPKWLYYNWIMYYLPQYREIAKAKATTMGHIQRRHLKSSLVLLPDKNSLSRMDKILSPLFNRIVQTKIESENLIQIKNKLLPELLSGKVRLSLEVK